MVEAAPVSKNHLHSQVLFDYLKAPTFRKALDASGLAKLQAQVDHYKHFSQGKIESLEFQERAISDACRKSTGLWCGELWTGSGKSIIAARVALQFLNQGKKVIFICPNRMGIGTVADGIIQKFHRTFEHYKASYRIGNLDAVTLLDDVHFFTPHAFVRMARTGDALFRKLVAEAGVLIVDEAHHFPEDPEDDQVIYGKIERLASRHFLTGHRKVVTLTATHGRHDGKPVFKKHRPDFQITVNEAVQAGWCPEIHGLPVYLDVQAPRAKQVAGEYYLNLKGSRLLRYLRKVAGVMLEVQKANPGQQYCAFVRTIREAKKLKEIWDNEAGKYGFKPVAILIGTMSAAERLKVKEAIQNGEYVGYITCDVGSESIDIPKLECVHLIRRTRSLNKIVQSIGRVLRNHPEKRRALVVDYNLSERKIIKACKGLEAYAKYVRSSAKRLISGGPLVPIEGTPNADFQGVSIGEERAWVERSLMPGLIPEGRVFGWLTVLRYENATHIICRCKCGGEYLTQRYRLLDGSSVSCGCMRSAVAKLEPGTRFGKLVVEEYVSTFDVRCKCDCGESTSTSKHGLESGSTKSCGCLREPHGPLQKGRRFGKLTIIEDLDSEHVKCRCDCGNEVIFARSKIRAYKRSCGCDQKPVTPAVQEGSRFGRLEVLEDCGHGDVVCVCDCGNVLAVYRDTLLGKKKKSCGCIDLERLSHLLEGKPGITPYIDGKGGFYLEKGTTFGWLTVIEETRSNLIPCQCRCGNIIRPEKFKLIRGQSKSCGCRGKAEPFQPGTVLGRLTVLSDEGSQKVECRCECGKVVVRPRTPLRSGNVQSCGCLKRGQPILIGTRFGRLVVVEDRGSDNVICHCDCGREKVALRGSLKRGCTSSCGCLWRQSYKKPQPGQRFNSWTVLREETPRKVHCRCECGVEKDIQRKHLYSGASKSCGCSFRHPILTPGTVFGSLTVMADSKDPGVKGFRRKVECKCVCGKTRTFKANELISGNSISCGCRMRNALAIGRRFGLLRVVEDKGTTTVHCACDCGNKAVTSRYSLLRGQKSCGCVNSVARRLSPGAKFGDWTIISDTGARRVEARCACGFIKKDVYRPNLTGGGSQRCHSCAVKRLVEINKAKRKVT